MKKILIAEDEEVYSRALALVLQRAGFEVDTALNGIDAVDLLKKNHYDLLFTDLMMPKMNGFEILKAMNDLHISVPTVVLSNLSQEADEKKARNLGAVDFIAKSNTKISEVLERAQKILGRN